MFSGEISFPGLNHMQAIHPNLTGVPKDESKVKLELVNYNKGEGYSILQQEQIENDFHEHKFCDYFFYTKKYNLVNTIKELFIILKYGPFYYLFVNLVNFKYFIRINFFIHIYI